MSNRTTICLTVPPSVDEALDRLAAHLGKPRSVVVSGLVLAAEKEMCPPVSGAPAMVEAVLPDPRIDN